jgi:hypothetical protein
VLAFLRSHFRDSIRSVTHKTQVPDLRRRTARRRVGMRFVAAQSVGEPTVRMPVFASGREPCRPAIPDSTARPRPDLQPGWGLTKTNQEWSEKLDTALTATRRDDLKHGSTPAYVHGCVCSECRAHQRVRMARNRG